MTASPDAPRALGKRNTPLAWGEYLAVRAILGGAALLPDRVRAALVEALARAGRRLDGERSRIAREFQAQALGPAPSGAVERERVLDAWRHFFRLSLNTAAFERRVGVDTIADHLTVTPCEGLDAALAGGRGGILITPHVGDWEAACAAYPSVGLRPFHAISRPPRNRPLSAHLLALRERRGVGIVPRREGIARVATLLSQGAWVGMMLDQRPGGRSVTAPFFGRPATCERTPAVLARRVGVPLLFSACYQTERPFHYELVFSRLVSPEELAGLSAEQVCALVNAEMEALILARPEQYLWLHDRYRGAPWPG
ncbi:MAG: lysophospholipid acyltransferase family protein [Planctomycetota bacterium]|jgi:KDO2-lipid IV(A) lauroyltransferase|nr:lysophospholipid acyltransferase family protein [Planctomycetota bacterium]MDP6761350.1 lysophospholipid acyltransferase family protein [Planctomycetota bacterium]MDP6990845.1 lysophospholipid acyltransferase family protein [Planctomycetota bacterium]